MAPVSGTAYTKLLRPLLFRLDPERVHHIGMALIARGLIRARLVVDPRLSVRQLGVDFPNPVGLAAGFDKDGVAIDRWAGLGFGFAEIGTVTPIAQPGNPKPRLFRLPGDQAVINRFGFNNQGAQAMAARLERARPGIPIGINLGKNKETAAEDAAADYQAAFRQLHTYGDYFVVNVSSPNTPGLRALQDRASLEGIVAAMREVNAIRPILIKVSPDLSNAALDEVIEMAMTTKISGLIATNTTLDRSKLTRDPGELGGLSGAPLRTRSTEVLAALTQALDPSMTLIGVGGIFTAEDVITKLAAGAHLTQIYTGWVYGGPSLVPRILLDLLAHLDAQGMRQVSEFRA
ncbi:MAG: quinone-dependent dihydroorotate dehydrogenase [Chthonomonas sp.]|nr:quinone-dependent dihydroorotate dehydrogenase [Chthonomonas sp.]